MKAAVCVVVLLAAATAVLAFKVTPEGLCVCVTSVACSMFMADTGLALCVACTVQHGKYSSCITA